MDETFFRLKVEKNSEPKTKGLTVYREKKYLNMK